ncbi:MAG TPA: zf-HC2 domain-containing protein [Candidatus Aminicenantes bacterium]|nr:zf-HC2 domain-containing protein [Candidatus Aminicenantes bacterium]
MTACQRNEELLSAYLEGELGEAGRAEVEAHLAACRECAGLAALMKEGMAAAADFPEAEPSAGLMARLYAIPEAGRERKRIFRPAFGWLARPALQPVYAAVAGFLVVLSFVLFHPEGRGIRKAVDVGFHRGVGAVEKLYAEAGGIKGEINAVSAGVVKTLSSLGLFQGDSKKQ